MPGSHLLLLLLPGIGYRQHTLGCHLSPLGTLQLCLLRRKVHTQELLQDSGLTFVSRRRSLHSDSVSTLSNTTLWVPFIWWESIVTAIPSKGNGPVKKQVQTDMNELWTRSPHTPTPSLDKEVERRYTFSEKTGQFPRNAHSSQTLGHLHPSHASGEPEHQLGKLAYSACFRSQQKRGACWESSRELGKVECTVDRSSRTGPVCWGEVLEKRSR